MKDAENLKRMDRMVFDLGTTRDKTPVTMRRWKYLFVGKCTGDVLIALGSPNASPLDPGEFDKLEDIEEYKYMYVTNSAQTGESLSIYFESNNLVDTVDIQKR